MTVAALDLGSGADLRFFLEFTEAGGTRRRDSLASCVTAALWPQRVAGSREQGGPRLFLRADRTLDYGRVNQIMGEINAAGIRKLSLVSTAASGGE